VKILQGVYDVFLFFFLFRFVFETDKIKLCYLSSHRETIFTQNDNWVGFHTGIRFHVVFLFSSTPYFLMMRLEFPSFSTYSCFHFLYTLILFYFRLLFRPLFVFSPHFFFARLLFHILQHQDCVGYLSLRPAPAR
jgi:hypothetical protein